MRWAASLNKRKRTIAVESGTEGYSLVCVSINKLYLYKCIRVCISRMLGVVNMLKIQMVSSILCLVGCVQSYLVVEVSVQNKKKIDQRGHTIKTLCGVSLVPRPERPTWANEGRSSEVRHPLLGQALHWRRHNCAKSEYQPERRPLPKFVTLKKRKATL